MHPYGPAPAFLTLAVALFMLFSLSGCATPSPPGDEGGGPSGGVARKDPAGTDPEGKTFSAAVPARDVRGGPVPGLPRPPASVRVGYSEGRAEGLALVRARYLTEKGPGGTREFYMEAFRSGGWSVANVEYSGGWNLLVVRGDLEAEVEIRVRGGGSEVVVEITGPAEREPGQGQGVLMLAGGSKR